MPTTFATPGRQASPEELTARRGSWPTDLPHSGMALFARPQVGCERAVGSSKAASSLLVWPCQSCQQLEPSASRGPCLRL